MRKLHNYYAPVHETTLLRLEPITASLFEAKIFYVVFFRRKVNCGIYADKFGVVLQTQLAGDMI